MEDRDEMTGLGASAQGDGDPAPTNEGNSEPAPNAPEADETDSEK